MSEKLEPIEDVVARDLSGWAQFIFNVIEGNNEFRRSEYFQLIRLLDDLVRERDDLRAKLAEAQRA